MGQRSAIPAVHEVLALLASELDIHGHEMVTGAVRAQLSITRAKNDGANRADTAARIATEVSRDLAEAARPALRRVFNMTGTVLHTNLGRALYAEPAIDAALTAMRYPLALEYDLEEGRRGQRDSAVQQMVSEITGAEDAIVVNNNAAAVLLMLAALAAGKETIVSRGELIEIGGAFRMPDVMESAGTQLREVGTTNRTHLSDYAAAIGPNTGLVMKVHPSNYQVVGFSRSVSCAELAPVARAAGVPLVDDLGSGVLVELARYGLPHERTVQEALAEGVDLVTFSGDKLLGGPQAGIIAGRRDLVQLCARHPLKRALRLDKVRLAALEATLRLYRADHHLVRDMPTIRHLAADPSSLAERGQRILAAVAGLGEKIDADLRLRPTSAQVGSGAMPLDVMPSLALILTPHGGGADTLAARLRRLPIPVIGRIERGQVILDLRCCDDEAVFISNLQSLAG